MIARSTPNETTTGRGRKWSFVLLVFLLCYILLETVSWVTYRAVYGKNYSLGDLQALREEVIESPSQPIDPKHVLALPANAQESLHPYTGYVLDPDKDNVLEVNKYGFVGPVPPLYGQKPDDEVSVIIVGGSVTLGLVNDAGEQLVAAISAAEALTGKTVRLYSLALAGMKQPQQLMALMFMLNLGASPDIVINLDGFNDAVLPVDENTIHDVYPFYPRGWSLRLGSGLTDPTLLRKAGRLAYRERFRYWLARGFATTPLNWSITAGLIWRLGDARLEVSILTSRYFLIASLRDSSAVEEGFKRRFSTHGPRTDYASEEELYREVVEFWAQSSRLMHNLSLGSGFRYFHFLQPNQYVAGSKIMSAQEKAIALKSDHPYSQPAAKGYTYLIEYGRKRLARPRGFFTDLTMMFADDARILYSDNCCHLNIEGNRSIAQRMGQIIRAELDRAP